MIHTTTLAQAVAPATLKGAFIGFLRITRVFAKTTIGRVAAHPAQLGVLGECRATSAVGGRLSCLEPSQSHSPEYGNYWKLGSRSDARVWREGPDAFQTASGDGESGPLYKARIQWNDGI
jgi:hypothetical protein